MEAVRKSLEGQYQAGLAMLRQEIERCPEEVWTKGTHPRQPWRIAYHAAFYTHLYLMPNPESFSPWKKHRETAVSLEQNAESVRPYTPAELLEYVDHIEQNLSDWLAALDLTAEDCGFYWYKGHSKLDHQIMNVRHLQGHVGQISEHLFAHGVDLDWVGKRP